MTEHLDLFSASESPGPSEPPVSRGPDSAQVIVGEVVTITYADEESGFVVGSVRAADTSSVIRFVGRDLPGVQEGVFVHFRGAWKRDPKHGRQFEVTHVVARLPIEEDAALRYIVANVKGCGPASARDIVATLGPACVQVLAMEPTRIREVFKPGKKLDKQVAVWTEWARRYNENRTVEEVHERLMGSGITLTQARKIVQTLGPTEAQHVVLYRPYTLVQVPGIGFRTADEIARGMGIATDDPSRVAAGVIYALEQAMEFGHSGLPRAKLVRKTKDSLRLKGDADSAAIDVSMIEQAITDALQAGVAVEEHGLIYKAPVARQEQRVADRLAQMVRRKVHLSDWQQSTIETVISRVNLSPDQAEGVRLAFRSAVFVLTGRPGSGKTTTLKTFLDCCDALGWGDQVLVAAPTGKAASRASEVIGRPAKTVHRMIGVQYGKRRPSPLLCKYVVLDETSMCDLGLVAWLLENLDLERCSLLIVGDNNQLPSVGHGRVLGDLIDSGVIPQVSLEKIFRQQEGSLITVNAHRVLDRGRLDLSNRAGSDFFFIDVSIPGEVGEDGFLVEDPDRSAKECRFAQQRLVESIQRLRNQGADPLRDIQVLTPMRKNALGVTELNRLVQSVVNPHGTVGPYIGDGAQVRTGDRVIQVKNDYNLGVFNGDQGEVLDVNPKRQEVRVAFGEEVLTLSKEHLRNIHLSWAISVHRSQGSEFPYVLMLYHTSHNLMLSRALLYTGITRARKMFCLIGNEAAIRLTFQKGEYAEARHTGLTPRLQASTMGTV